MAPRSIPPFRADHVGSLLRPQELHEAREKKKKGEISAEALRQVEDKCIREAVKMQEDIGFHRFFESQHYVIRGKFPASRGSILIVATVAGGLIVASLAVVLAIAPGAFEK